MEVDCAAPAPRLARTRHVACTATFLRLRLCVPLRCPALFYAHCRLLYRCWGGVGRPDAALFASALAEAVRQLYGLAGGGALAYSLTSFDAACGEGVVRCGSAEEGRRVGAAAALLTSMQGRTCSLALLATSPFLAALASDSRGWCDALDAGARE